MFSLIRFEPFRVGKKKIFSRKPKQSRHDVFDEQIDIVGRVIFVVQVENGFSAIPDAVVNSAIQNGGFTNGLPVEREVCKLPRQYVVNVIYTIVGNVFSQWVRSRVNLRNDKLLQDQNRLIEMDP